MKLIKKALVILLKKLDLGSAIAVRLVKITGKSKEPIHPKHFLSQKPWFTKHLNEDDLVLDVGCGNGQNTIKISRVANSVVGVDIDKKLLKIAKRSVDLLGIKNIKFEIVNLEEKLKYQNHSFDKIIFLDVLEHLNNRYLILKEIKRILKPEGLLFIGVPNSQTSWKKFQCSVGINSFSDPDHKVEFSENEISSLLNLHSFKIINFGYGTYDTPLRGLFDIIGGFSLNAYKKLSQWRKNKAKRNPQEASGFEIVARNNK